MRNKWLSTILIVNFSVLLLSLILYSSKSLDVLDKALYDSNMRNSAQQNYYHDIVVVGIDDQSLQELGAWPWDRKTYIPLLQTLQQQGAKVVAFDVMFNERSNPESDEALADELSKHHNVILPAQAVFEGAYNDVNNHNRTQRSTYGLIRSRGIELPLPELASASHLALINANLDQDGMIRKSWLQVETPEGIIPSLAFKTLELAGADPDELLKRYPEQDLNIKFDLYSSDFTTIPFSQVLKGTTDLRDRIVLIGFTANGLEQDNGGTPLERRAKLVYVHANIIHQLLNETKIHTENRLTSILSILLIVGLFAAAAWRLKPIPGIVLIAASVGALLWGQYLLFDGFGWDTAAIYPLIALLLAYFSNLAVKTYYETKKRQYITKQFGRYISPVLVRQIAQSGQDIQLGGINKELTVLFLDIRGFTTLSERLTPEEVVGFLNLMFNLITEKALANNGTIDKFIGDAAMLLFNAPVDVEQHEYWAVKTAYEIQEGMKSVRSEIYQKYGVKVSVGIGIHTGPVTVGNIGSYLRVDYTAIGDNVNTAARIESCTEPDQILISGIVAERTSEAFEYRDIGEKQLKGKSAPIRLYEVVGPK